MNQFNIRIKILLNKTKFLKTCTLYMLISNRKFKPYLSDCIVRDIWKSAKNFDHRIFKCGITTIIAIISIAFGDSIQMHFFIHSSHFCCLEKSEQTTLIFNDRMVVRVIHHLLISLRSPFPLRSICTHEMSKFIYSYASSTFETKWFAEKLVLIAVIKPLYAGCSVYIACKKYLINFYLSYSVES